MYKMANHFTNTWLLIIIGSVMIVLGVFNLKNSFLLTYFTKRMGKNIWLVRIANIVIGLILLIKGILFLHNLS